MKKHLLVVIALIALVGFKPDIKAQTGFNTVIEYCTGTWCQYCPCGHAIINDIVANFPNTMVLGYHGPVNYGDPWATYSQPMISLFGFNSYPTGVIGRKSGILSRSAWNNQVVIQSNTIQPGISIVLNNKSYNAGTRTLTGSIVMTALTTLSGSYSMNLVLTEDNLIYNQTGNTSAGCIGGSQYVHKHVVKDLINGSTGQVLNTSSDVWTQGTSVTVPLNYVVPAGVVDANAKVNILVYLNTGNISTEQLVQQTRMEGVTQPTGIHNTNTIPETYSLSQNYPNPFNPTTNINFSIPKSGNVSFKFYNSMGQEVSTYVDGFMEAGIYHAEFDGSNLSSGIYFYTLKTDDFVETKKMMLVK